MDKKYNGFNNGRDRSDGVGGREVNHGKQETMTKEQECVIQKFKIAELIWDFNPHGRAKKVETILIEIDILIDKQLSAERERAGKLVEALKELAWHLDTLKAYHLVESIKQTLNEYDTATKEPGSH